METYTKTQITELLLNKRIAQLTDDVLTLEDGTQLEVECTDQDCCASAGGTWYVGSTDSIDALITTVEITDPVCEYDDSGFDEYESRVSIMLYHDGNLVAKNEVYADAGNGGYYYSVASLKVTKVNDEPVFIELVASGEGSDEYGYN